MFWNFNLKNSSKNNSLDENTWARTQRNSYSPCRISSKRALSIWISMPTDKIRSLSKNKSRQRGLPMMRTQCTLAMNIVFRALRKWATIISIQSQQKTLQIDTKRSKNQIKKMLHFQAQKKKKQMAKRIVVACKIYEKFCSCYSLTKTQMIWE